MIVRNAGLIVPPSAGGANYELSAIASQLRDWAADSTIAEQHCATFLLTENLNDLHPLVARNPQAACIAVPLPTQAELLPALDYLQRHLSAAAQAVRPAISANPPPRSPERRSAPSKPCCKPASITARNSRRRTSSC